MGIPYNMGKVTQETNITEMPNDTLYGKPQAKQ